MNVFTLAEFSDSKKPLYQRLYLYIAGEIKAGGLRPGEKLPSKKALAAHLRISQNTVETAYSMLAAEGYVTAKPRSGFYVAKIDSLILDGTEKQPLKAEASVSRYCWDFPTNAVDVASFPFATWAKLSREVMSRPELLAAGDARGDPALRESLAKYLHEFRGVKCSPEQLVVGAGIEYLLMVLCTLLEPGLSFAVEDPGYRRTAAVLKSCGRTVAAVPLDSGGMPVQALRESGADAAYITPSHQFPTGIVMPVARRAELLSWAAEQENRWLIEDDYNSEFHFSGRPIPAAQGLDRRDKVIYLSTFSRTLAPSIRIAYMVLPRPLLERFLQQAPASTVSRFEQQALSLFLSGGYLGRHLNRMKTIYRKRLESVAAFFEALDGVTISGGRAGLHLLVRSGLGRAELARRGEIHGIRLYFLSDYYLQNRQDDGTLVIGCAGASPEQIKEAYSLIFPNSCTKIERK